MARSTQVLAAAAVATAAAAAPDGVNEAAFDRYDFVVGAARGTVLTGAFLADESRLEGASRNADVAFVGASDPKDGTGARPLRFYRLAEDGWTLALEARLPAGTLFVDTAVVAGRERVVAYRPGRLTWFDAQANAHRPLAAVATRYRSDGERGGALPKLDVTPDLTGDGLDDLLLPDVDGFFVATQSPDGAFGEPAKLGPPEPYRHATAVGAKHPYAQDGITSTNLPWYLGRVHRADYDQDGRPDLLFWNQDRFDVHYQNEAGAFAAEPEPAPVAVPFDADGAYALMFEYTDENLAGMLLGLRKETRLTTLHTLRDLNGDGIPDLVTHALRGRRLGNHRSTYRVYYGAPTPGGTRFGPEPDAWIRPRGTAGALQAAGYSRATIGDLYADGATYALFADVSVGFGGMVRAMAGRSVALNIELHRLAGDDAARDPAARLRLRPKLYPAGKGVFFPPVLFGDVHGDGLPDLVVGQSREELRIFAGTAGTSGGWARRPQKVAVALPDDERETFLVDFNGDGAQDLLIHDTTRSPHRVTTLLAR